MSSRSVYLAKYRGAASQRAHFALFVPNAGDDRAGLGQNFRATPCKGTIIHVVGEPVMGGYHLEFKRNYECSDSQDLRELITLGHVDSGLLFNPTGERFVKEATPRGGLDREATRITPPPGGQDVRAPIDGINTKRCQEWTMEYLHRLVGLGIINREAIQIAQSHRDPPFHGIFGQRRAA